jgi:hypothetical protein
MDGWIATLSDGSTVYEKWIEGQLSPWQRLMHKCVSSGVHITSLKMFAGGTTVHCPQGARGYWAAHSALGVQGGPQLTRRGIGWVDGDKVVIKWATEVNRRTFVEDDVRSVHSQKQIIWSHQ